MEKKFLKTVFFPRQKSRFTKPAPKKYEIWEFLAVFAVVFTQKPVFSAEVFPFQEIFFANAIKYGCGLTGKGISGNGFFFEKIFAFFKSSSVFHFV